MHSFMRAIGFEQLNNVQLEELLNKVVASHDYIHTATDSQGNEFVQYTMHIGESMGICACGSYLENGEFSMDYYYPFFLGSGITSHEQVGIEKHADKESYAAVCDDIKVGVTLIYFLQNVGEYLSFIEDSKGGFPSNVTSTMAGLSLGGKIILPINKNEKQIRKNEKTNQNRNHLIAAARDGDEDAIESLTLEDIDTYSMISRRIANEDILSIVDSYFMPHGIESDQYSILGEILNYYYVSNSFSQDRICVMTVDTNDLVYNICINENDLVGVPAVGRRFKGNIWMQGTVNIRN
ncbi:MAG: DUF3881 family protein [Lachnospiraceae bacterium]|uniref:DUF3881 family protein n=1 Tax=Roseburia sp. 1XD42-69 TaxID=2320088 RepID=UPI000E9FFE23|nr:DUF3881 family protein [Roseburia sp. 1XD42-69]MCI8875418.1 DUF3881 family protein [Lachnospiraceae bacterium]RKJ63521.1 DUF3881 family protein [Roseburia sp. 1XD42-69]